MTDAAFSLEVKRRLRKLNILLTTLARQPLLKRNRLLRLFLFQGQDPDADLQIEKFRKENVHWRRKTEVGTKKLIFPYYFKIEKYLRLLATRIDFINKAVKNALVVRALIAEEITLRAQRFASLVFTLMLFIHPYKNGNKRTSHAAAWSYLSELDPVSKEEYLPIKSLNLEIWENYLKEDQNSDELVCGILDYVLSIGTISSWLSFIEAGEWLAQINEPPGMDLFRAAINSVLLQIQSNVEVTANSWLPTTPENFFADSTTLFEAEDTALLDEEIDTTEVGKDLEP